MGLLTMQPKRVFYYFEEISKIPRGSGNTRQISDYCVQFAKEHRLRCIQDETNNMILFKEGSAGREDEEPVILQGHLDMVCEKNLDCEHDFEKEGIRLVVEGDRVRADGTTLGGDDGIAVAYGLAILEDDTLSHPPLEVVFTVDEETGMDGAAALDVSVLKGTRMLNIDSEEEGVLLTSCAGGVKCSCHIPVTYVIENGLACIELTITGLLGGHSGTEIDKGRCNANTLMGRLLFSLSQKLPFGIAKLEGGMQDNAIPREAMAVITVEPKLVDKALEEVGQFLRVMRAELSTKEPKLDIQTASALPEKSVRTLSPSSKQSALFFLVQAPDGVQEMSGDIEGLVETSLNLGVMRLTDEELICDFALRSSKRSAKEALKHKLAYLTEFLGGECLENGDYPAWEYKSDSAFRTVCVEAYRQVYDSEPKVMALHAGLECGILADKIEGFDAVSMGPDIYDIHTPKESMSVSSVQRTWEYLLKILELA